jgi:hypothetical protein
MSTLVGSPPPKKSERKRTDTGTVGRIGVASRTDVAPNTAADPMRVRSPTFDGLAIAGRETGEWAKWCREPARSWSGSPVSWSIHRFAPDSPLEGWREMDSNFRFLVVRPSNRHGRRDCCLENGSGSVGEPKVRIHLPPAASHERALWASAVIPRGQFADCQSVGSRRVWRFAPNQVPRAERRRDVPTKPALLLRSLGAVAPRDALRLLRRSCCGEAVEKPR